MYTMLRYDDYMKKNGFSIIELIVAITIIGIISLLTSGIIISTVQTLFYTPMGGSSNFSTPALFESFRTGEDIVKAMVDGSDGIPGIRYATRIVDTGGSPTLDQLTFEVGYPTSNDKRLVRFIYLFPLISSPPSPSAYVIYRAVTPLGDLNVSHLPTDTNQMTKIPYYTTKIEGCIALGGGLYMNRFFRYWQGTGGQTLWQTGSLSNINRVEISFIINNSTRGPINAIVDVRQH